MRVYLTPKAQKDLDRLPSKLNLRIQVEIAKLAVDPFPLQCKKLQGWENLYRIRIGDYRAVYEFNKITQSITVARIKHRKEVYR